MGSLTPIATALGIVVVLFGIGAFIAYFRDRRKFHGYEDLMSEAAMLAKKLDGEVFRDGEDLVVSGNVDRMPTYVRFSHAETTPGVHIRMEAPANVRLAVAPRSAPPTEGRATVRTGDESLDSRCVVRCEEPMHAKLFVGSKPVIAELLKLCCSSRTFFTVVTGAMELSELTIPHGDVGRHVAEHIASMRRLVPEIEKLPGSDKVKVQPLKRERHLVLKTAIAIGLVAAFFAVFAATKQRSQVTHAAAAVESLPAGVLPADAPEIVGLKGWRLATESEFDGDSVGWIRSFLKEPTGRIAGKFGPRAEAEDSAYVLVNGEGTRRLVIIADGMSRYDTRFSHIGVLALVPKANVGKIEWAGSPPDNPDGDGVLIVRTRGDRSSGVIFFTSGGRVVTGVPVDYQRVDLME